MDDRPVLLQRFPNGASGSNFFQKRIPESAPEWLQTTIVQHAERHRVAGAGDRRPRPLDLGGQHRLPRVPLVADARRRSGALRRAAHRPRSRARAPTSRWPRRPPRARKQLLDELGVAGYIKTIGQPRAARLRPPAPTHGTAWPCAAPPSPWPASSSVATRPDHRVVVEGGARRADLHRLQPERSAQDGVRAVVGARPRPCAGVVPVPVGRAADAATRTT